MKINIKNISDILQDNLTLVERGILITILLLKDDDSKLTLAKVKAKNKLKDAKHALINLHELKLITWSGYKAAKKSVELKSVDSRVIEVVGFMNNLLGTRFNHHARTNKPIITNIQNRILETSVAECKLVISNRYAEWKDDSVMNIHLNASTLFRASKFPKYLEEANRTRKGESLLEAAKIGLNDGDEITYDISKTFLDNDVYETIVYMISPQGNKLGNGRVEKKYGKDLKRAIKILHNSEISNTAYFYKGR